jgi:hypothetical protein
MFMHLHYIRVYVVFCGLAAITERPVIFCTLPMDSIVKFRAGSRFAFVAFSLCILTVVDTFGEIWTAAAPPTVTAVHVPRYHWRFSTALTRGRHRTRFGMFMRRRVKIGSILADIAMPLTMAGACTTGCTTRLYNVNGA